MLSRSAITPRPSSFNTTRVTSLDSVLIDVIHCAPLVDNTANTKRESDLESGQDGDWLAFKLRFIDQQEYKEPGLSIALLAAKLVVPEYRLRRLINKKLGYRNFNELLHEYRIRNACLQLADPSKNTTPILTIALTQGYQSINPFNKAFRQLKGCTPSEFRKKTQLGSNDFYASSEFTKDCSD